MAGNLLTNLPLLPAALLILLEEVLPISLINCLIILKKSYIMELNYSSFDRYFKIASYIDLANSKKAQIST